jgi:hypothetical protein
MARPFDVRYHVPIARFLGLFKAEVTSMIERERLVKEHAVLANASAPTRRSASVRPQLVESAGEGGGAPELPACVEAGVARWFS